MGLAGYLAAVIGAPLLARGEDSSQTREAKKALKEGCEASRGLHLCFQVARVQISPQSTCAASLPGQVYHMPTQEEGQVLASGWVP